MDDPEIVALATALGDPDEVASRKEFIDFAFQRRQRSGKAADLAYAKTIYFHATRRDNTDGLNPDSALARKFIDDMDNGVAQRGDFTVALEWFKSFRRRNQGIPDLPWSVLKDDVDEFLTKVELRMRAFLSKEQLVPAWHPPLAWRSACVGQSIVDLTEHLASLAIPLLVLSSAEHATPDLLLYLLGAYGPVDGERMNARVQELIDMRSNITLVNTSGSGKTRLLFEILCRDWGLYLACIWNAATSPHGSSDIHRFTDPAYLQQRRTPTGSPFVPNAKGPAQLGNNVTIAHHVMQVILIARLLIFKRFLDVCDQLRPTWAAFRPIESPLARAKRAWVLLQAFPRLSESGCLSGGEDIFTQLSDKLQNLRDTDHRELITSLLDNLESRGALPRYIVFDEVQVAATTLKSAFPKTAGSSGRPLLKPIVTSIYPWFSDARLLIAGTHLYQGDVEAALYSRVLKLKAAATFSNIGGYFREADIIVVLNHFFTAPLVESWGPELLREIVFWFRGRHRFLTYFIQCVLMEGPALQSLWNVIANIRYAAAGSPLPRELGYRDLRLQIRSLIPIMFPLKDGEPGRPTAVSPFKESVVVRTARHAILSFLTTFTYPNYNDAKMLQLVELGIGRFLDRQDGTVRVSERLVLAALVNYFNDESNPVNLRTMVHYWLSKRDGLPQVAGFGFELALVHVFWDLFSAPEGRLVSDVFDFDCSIETAGGKTRAASGASKPVMLDYTPSWASYRARLIGDFAFNRSGGPRVVQRDAFSSPLARRARTAEDTLDWFHDMLRYDGFEQGMPPFLLPDFGFGPDLAFGLQLEHPSDLTAEKLFLLVLVTGKNWETKTTAGSPKDRGGAAVRSAIFTMSPEGLFTTLRSNTKLAKQEEMRAILANFPPLPGTVRPKTAAEVATLLGKTEPPESSTKKKGKKTKAQTGADDGEPASASKSQAKKKTNTKQDNADTKEKLVFPYGDTVEFGVLRCFASYPNTVRLPHITTDEGVYPFASLTSRVIEHGGQIGFAAFNEAMLRVVPQPAKMDEEIVEDENDMRTVHAPHSANPPIVPAPSVSNAPSVPGGPNPADPETIISDYIAPEGTLEDEAHAVGEDPTDGDDGSAASDEENDEDPMVERSDYMDVDDADEDDSKAMSVDNDAPSTSTRKRQGSPLPGETTQAKRRYRQG